MKKTKHLFPAMRSGKFPRGYLLAGKEEVKFERIRWKNENCSTSKYSN